MGIYKDYILPWVTDWTLNTPEFRRLRRRIAQGLEGALVRRMVHAVLVLLLSATWLVAFKIIITRYERARKRRLKAARIAWWIFLSIVGAGFAAQAAYVCLWSWHLLFSAG